MNGILLVFTGRTSSLLEGRWRYCLGWGTFPWSFCTKKHAIRDFERRFSLPVAWTTSTMYVVQASEGSQGAKNTSSSRTCLALRVCLALALRLPRTCLRSPCKTLKMQANCYPPPPPKGQPLILLQASFLRWKITSITNKLIYFLLEPLFGSYTILPHGSLYVKKNWERTRLDATDHSFFSVHGQLNTAWTILYPKLFLHMTVSSQVIKQVYQTTQIKGTFLKKLRCCVDKIIRLST